MHAVLEPNDWDDKIHESLRDNFGLEQFRLGQEDVVRAVLAGTNSVVVMPTGAGKSLCYQLPATLLPGITLVVSPLISLMHDQVGQLEQKKIPATFLNSTLSEGERDRRLQDLKAGKYKLVYVAPERLMNTSFLDALSQVQVDLFAIDEAHCISQWGHDFRPDYSQLGQARKRIRPPRTVALTATATPEVRKDIVKSLLLKDPKVFVAGFDRPNLFLEVLQVTGDDDKRRAIAELASSGGSGIVYCSTRKSAESLTDSLKGKGLSPILYHAGLDDDERARAQDKFMSSQSSLAIATNAFGMGIDKPDIRFVAHANIPRAVEGYYQEIGRAGRDGKPAHVALLFNHADVHTQRRMIESSHPTEVVFQDVWQVLQGVQQFERGIHALAEAIGATEFEVSSVLKVYERKGFVSRSQKGEGAYRITRLAKTPPKKADPLADYLFAQLAPNEGGSFTLQALGRNSGQTETALRASLKKLENADAISVRKPFAGRVIRIADTRSFHELPLDLSRFRVQEQHAEILLRRMTDYAYATTCRREFLLRYFGEGSGSGSCGNCDTCSGARVTLKKRAATRKVEATGDHSELAAMELRRFRNDLAKALAIPPYIIFNDNTLFALATALPLDRSSFLAVKGAGPAKWERFGPKIIEICALARAAGPAKARAS